MSWPLEPQGARRSPQGLEEILVVEEKRQVIEYQIKEELYNWRARHVRAARGRQVRRQRRVVDRRRASPPATGCCPRTTSSTPALIAKAIAKRLAKLGAQPSDSATATASGSPTSSSRKERWRRPRVVTNRQPYFCSGCPHNTSTQVPEGSRARRRHRLPLHGALDGPQHRDLHPHGRRRRALDRPGAVHRATRTSSPTSATAPTSTRACSRSAPRSPPAST